MTFPGQVIQLFLFFRNLIVKFQFGQYGLNSKLWNFACNEIEYFAVCTYQYKICIFSGSNNLRLTQPPSVFQLPPLQRSVSLNNKKLSHFRFYLPTSKESYEMQHCFQLLCRLLLTNMLGLITVFTVRKGPLCCII